MLSIEELSDLEEVLKEELNEKLLEIIIRLNRNNKLEEFLRLLNMEEFLKKGFEYEVARDARILVIGQSNIREEELMAVAKQLGLDKQRFEFCLDYDKVQKFNFNKIQWNPTYSLILVGPMPHSGVAKGDFGSIISSIESSDGYPPVKRLGSNSLKITKSNFKAKLQEMIDMGIIV